MSVRIRPPDWAAERSDRSRLESLVMPTRMLADLFKISERRAPLEMVCLIAAEHEQPDRLVAMAEVRNDACTPRTHFAVRPFDQWRLETRWMGEGRRLRAVAHSHVNRGCRPSVTDLEFLPAGLAMVIVSLHGEACVWQDGVELELVLEKEERDEESRPR